jgi:hypothetical protein
MKIPSTTTKKARLDHGKPTVSSPTELLVSTATHSSAPGWWFDPASKFESFDLETWT